MSPYDSGHEARLQVIQAIEQLLRALAWLDTPVDDSALEAKRRIDLARALIDAAREETAKQARRTA